MELSKDLRKQPNHPLSQLKLICPSPSLEYKEKAEKKGKNKDFFEMTY